MRSFIKDCIWFIEESSIFKDVPKYKILLHPYKIISHVIKMRNCKKLPKKERDKCYTKLDNEMYNDNEKR